MIPRERDEVVGIISNSHAEYVFRGMEREHGIKWETAWKEFNADQNRQYDVLRENGYSLTKEQVFLPAYDPKGKRAVAVIADFGEIYPGTKRQAGG